MAAEDSTALEGVEHDHGEEEHDSEGEEPGFEGVEPESAVVVAWQVAALAGGTEGQQWVQMQVH